MQEKNYSEQAGARGYRREEGGKEGRSETHPEVSDLRDGQAR